MLGISKESWMAALEKENYLKAAEMSMEDDYGMIDGIINNGPKEDKTAEVKAPERGEKSSIMDRLKSAKAEKQKECCPPKMCIRDSTEGAPSDCGREGNQSRRHGHAQGADCL